MTAVEPDARPAPAATRGRRSAGAVADARLPVPDDGRRRLADRRPSRATIGVGAVTPPAPLAAEKQRRLCLTAEYATCATFEAARAARPVAHDRTPILPRPLARTAPVVLDHGRLGIADAGDPCRSDHGPDGPRRPARPRLRGDRARAPDQRRSPGGCRRLPVDRGSRGARCRRVDRARGQPPTDDRTLHQLGAPAGSGGAARITRGDRRCQPDLQGQGRATPSSASPRSSAPRRRRSRTLNGLADSTSLRVGQVLKIP